VRFTLSLRQVEGLLFERGIDVSIQSSTTTRAASPGIPLGLRTGCSPTSRARSGTGLGLYRRHLRQGRRPERPACSKAIAGERAALESGFEGRPESRSSLGARASRASADLSACQQLPLGELFRAESARPALRAVADVKSRQGNGLAASCRQDAPAAAFSSRGKCAPGSLGSAGADRRAACVRSWR
jgi:hypothetical protein